MKLSRAASTSNQNDVGLQEVTEAVMELYVAHLPASTERLRLDEYLRARAEDISHQVLPKWVAREQPKSRH